MADKLPATIFSDVRTLRSISRSVNAITPVGQHIFNKQIGLISKLEQQVVQKDKSIKAADVELAAAKEELVKLNADTRPYSTSRSVSYRSSDSYMRALVHIIQSTCETMVD